MPSLQLYLFRPIMRVFRRWQARFATHDVQAYVRFRERADRLADLMMHPPHGVSVENTTVGGVIGNWIIPNGAPQDPVLVFLHGGGILFTWGSPHRRMVAYLAKFSGLRAFGVDYRLLPEYPYPAAHDDCFAVYQTLTQQGKQVVLIGESSGGVLALATLLRAKAAGLPQPLLCALISPTVDYGFTDARIWQSNDSFVHPKFVVEMHKHYIAKNDIRLPDLAPIYADLSNLAPLIVLVAEHDVLRGEVERLTVAAQRHQIKMDLMIWPHVWHGWHILAPQLPEATQALKAFSRAICQAIDG